MYDLPCSQTPGGNRDVLASLLDAVMAPFYTVSGVEHVAIFDALKK